MKPCAHKNFPCETTLGAQHAAARRGRRRAFTIIEVMVALAISAMMSVVLVASYMNVLHAYEAVAANPKHNLDLRFARNALLAEADYETAQKGTQFEGASGRQITWTSVIEPTVTADLFLVTFTCEFGPGQNDGEPAETITEVFRLLRPTWSNAMGLDRNTLRTEARDRILQELQPSPLSGLSGASSSMGGSSGSSGGSGGGSRSSTGGGSSGGGSTGGKTGGTTPRR